MADSDLRLIESWWARGDAEAFQEITTRYAGMVYATCHRILKNDIDAQDATQECFEVLASRKERPSKNLPAWLHRVAVNRSLTQIRSSDRRRAREQKFAETQPSEDKISWDDFYEFVDEAIADLPSEYQVPIVEHFIAGKTHAEIAEDLGIPRRTVSHRIQKGVESIREDLKKRGFSVSAASLVSMFMANLGEAAVVPSALLATLGKLAIGSAPIAAAGLGAGKIMAIAVCVLALFSLVAWTGSNMWRDRTPDTSVSPSIAEAATVESVVEAVDMASTAADAPPEGEQTHVDDESILSGYVRDSQTRAGIEGVQVSIYSTRDTRRSKSVYTDSSGYYTLPRMIQGEYRVSCVRANGYYIPIDHKDNPKYSKIVELSLNDPQRQINFSLDRGQTFRGRVIDGLGQPVEGASVCGYSRVDSHQFEHKTSSDDEGRFVLSGFPEHTRFYAWAEKDSLVSITKGPFGLPQVMDEPLDILIEEEAVIRGVAVDEANRPLPNLDVHVGLSTSDVPRHRGFNTETDDHGRFEITGLFADTIGLHVMKDNADIVTANGRVSVSPGDVVENHVLHCEVGMSISGVVVDSRGKPVYGVQVEAGLGHSITDSNGEFSMNRIDAGEYTVYAEHTFRFMRGQVHGVAAGATGVRIVLKDPLRVRGVVLDASTRTPIPDFEFKCSMSPDYIVLNQRYEPSTNGDGTFEVAVPPKSHTRIAARARGYLLGYTDIDISNGQAPAAPVEIYLKRQADLRGFVHDAAGNVLAGVAVQSGDTNIDNDETFLIARSDDKGEFILPADRIGHDFISVYHPQYPMATVALTDEHFSGTRIDVELQTRTSLTLNVRANGKPTPHAQVKIGNLRFQPDEQGQVHVVSLPAGVHEVGATHYLTDTGDSNAFHREHVAIVEGEPTELAIDFLTGDSSLFGNVEGNVQFMHVFVDIDTAIGTKRYVILLLDDTITPEYEITNLPSGRARVHARWRTYEGEEVHDVSNFDLGRGTSIRYDIGGSRGPLLSGKVLLPDEYQGASVTVFEGALSAEEVETRSDRVQQLLRGSFPVDVLGRFSTTSIKSGTYTVAFAVLADEIHIEAQTVELRGESVVIEFDGGK